MYAGVLAPILEGKKKMLEEWENMKYNLMRKDGWTEEEIQEQILMKALTKDYDPRPYPPAIQEWIDKMKRRDDNDEGSGKTL